MTRFSLLASTVALSGCANLSAPDVTRFMEPAVIATHGTSPASAIAGTCWAELESTPVLTSMTAQILTQSSQPTDGQSPTVGDGRSVWFERPCEREMTTYFIKSLQRALQARGLYRREINGEMDTATRFAVRLYQQPLGLDSGSLSLSASRSLGLSPVVLDTHERAPSAAQVHDTGAVFAPEVQVAEQAVPRPVVRP